MKHTIALALIVGLTLAAASALAAQPNKAKTLILKVSDFPKGATAKDSVGEATAEGSGWSVNYHFRSGGRPQELAVAVLTFKSQSMARQMFRELKSDVTSMAPKLVLEKPLYGDEQVASHAVLRGSQLLVRKGSVIWYLEPQTYMVRAGKQHELSRAQTIAIYEKYGRLQQRRIG